MLQGTFAVPGYGAIRETQESEIFWGPAGLRHFVNAKINSATVDSGNTPTTLLRPGLVLGKITSSGEYVNYSPTATDGSQVAVAVLPIGLRMTDIDGTAESKDFTVCVCGNVKASFLINLDSQARKQMRNNFLFDDDIPNKASFLGGCLREVAKTANYTVTAADNGTLFTTVGASGSVTFTLPALAAGLRYEFMAGADQNMVVMSAAGDDIITFNDLAADSLTFSTSGEKIGAWVALESNAAGTKWYAKKFGAHTMTVGT